MNSKIRKHRIYSALSPIISAFPFKVQTLCRFFGCDKHHPNGQDYGPIYQRIFRPLKYKSVRLLEIGVGGYGHHPGGKSLLVWQSYFARGSFVAADLHDKRDLATRRVEIAVCDQSDRAQLAALAADKGPFDIVIDDGSHLNAHQILTFASLFEHLSDTGIYVVEDVQTSFWSKGPWDGAAIGTEAFETTCMAYFVKLAAYLNHAEFMTTEGVDEDLLRMARKIRSISFVHNLIIVEKGDNARASNILGPDRDVGRLERTLAA